MSKFFVRSMGSFLSVIEPQLYDRLELAELYIQSRPEKMEASCEIYEITDSGVNKVKQLICYDKGIWLSPEEYKFRQSTDGYMIDLKNRHEAYGGSVEKWNEWVKRHNFGEEYLIK